MVTFNCEVCNATVPKKNTEKHYYRCPDAYYTCIDCSTTFDDGVGYQKHTECITEDQKYQKGLYKGKKQKQKKEQNLQNHQQNQQIHQQIHISEKQLEETKAEKEPSKTSKAAKSNKVSKKEANKGFPELQNGESLYKILKRIKNKDTRKLFLKSLVVNKEGTLALE